MQGRTGVLDYYSGLRGARNKMSRIIEEHKKKIRKLKDDDYESDRSLQAWSDIILGEDEMKKGEMLIKIAYDSGITLEEAILRLRIHDGDGWFDADEKMLVMIV